MLYSFFNTLVKGYLKYRKGRIQAMYETPVELQEEILTQLIDKFKNTQYATDYGLSAIKSRFDYRNEVPQVQYEELAPYVQKAMEGAENQLYPGKVSWFAKSSGTTNDRSKYIPITEDILFENHVAASWDAMSILYSNRPDAKNFEGKNLIMGGSLKQEKGNIITGDVSAILLNNMPKVGRPFYTPDFGTALMSDWEEKIEKMAEITSKENVVMFAGVPTWTIVLFNKILEITGKSNMREVWPDAKTYFHGGVGFHPYERQFREFFPDNELEYYEVYNASEGYFAVQDRNNERGMLLLLDNDIYYEFIPVEQSQDISPDILTLSEVEINKDYCIVITTSSGLWRYLPGDVVRFVTTRPYRILVSGRTKHYINVFGEEVMVHNTDTALKLTCEKLKASVSDYTVAPIFMNNEGKGGHEWWIEFSSAPDSYEKFADELDKALRSVNADYDAKRYKDIALQPLRLNSVPKGTFADWLRHKQKIGGQSKIPRLSNSREFINQLDHFIKTKSISHE